ncbi:spore germination protein GerW family protein [Agromyces archimandritae]|uniref:Sporulation protein YtfJ n=1 Tax=Agromyces archimandritae TaxID=2781962 RepID=A0A975FNZ4_9MICO|nr:spore germination protein GerW family protein [Agromyces archimandritae]QTX04516.1 hypothetical protein G127AT_14815 [Agromyces archimandritae]
MADLVVELANTVGGVGVKTSYADPIDIDGTTVIPVAVGYYGFGAGTGEVESGSGGEASGGGGGGASIPVGAYIGRGDDVRFEPNLIALIAVSVPAIWVAGRALARIVRALKR